MTTAEYETQSRMISKDVTKNKIAHKEDPAETSSQQEESNNPNESNGKSADNAEMKKPQDVVTIIQPLNLRMLQGAFIVLIVGYTMAGKRRTWNYIT